MATAPTATKATATHCLTLKRIVLLLFFDIPDCELKRLVCDPILALLQRAAKGHPFLLHSFIYLFYVVKSTGISKGGIDNPRNAQVKKEARPFWKILEEIILRHRRAGDHIIACQSI